MEGRFEVKNKQLKPSSCGDLGAHVPQLCYVTACDRQTETWQAEQQADENAVCVPHRRMDWFKLQRFEKVFNASSTRIVTKRGVK